MRGASVLAVLLLSASARAQEAPRDWLEREGVVTVALPGGVARLALDTGRVVSFSEHDGGVGVVASDLLVVGGGAATAAFDAAGALQWSVPGQWIRPVRAIDDLVVLRGVAGEREVVQAVEAVTGKVRWRKEVRRVLDGSEGALVLVEQPEGTLLALRPATGEPAWRWRVPAKGWITDVSPADSRVVVSYPGGTDVLDAVKGARLGRWKVPASGHVVGDLLVGRPGVIATGPVVVWSLPGGAERWRGPEPRVASGAPLLAPRLDGDQVLALEDGALRAHDLRTGALRWTTRLFDPPPGKRHGADLRLRDGVAYAADGDAVAAVELTTGRLVWRASRQGWGSVVTLPDALSVTVHGSPQLALVGDLVLYRISRERTVLAGLDAATGAIRWTKE